MNTAVYLFVDRHRRDLHLDARLSAHHFRRAASVSSPLETSAGSSPGRSLGFEDESSDAAKLGRAADVMKGHGSPVGGLAARSGAQTVVGDRSSDQSSTLFEYIKVAVSDDDTARPRALQHSLSHGVAEQIKRRDNGPVLSAVKIVAEVLRCTLHARDTSASVEMDLTRTKLAQQRPSRIYARNRISRLIKSVYWSSNAANTRKRLSKFIERDVALGIILYKYYSFISQFLAAI